MFVLTVDQVGSRHGPDRVQAWTDRLRADFGDRIALGPDRTAGDEFQLVLRDAASALELVLALTRDGGWSAGLGVGPVDEPLPPTAREAAGPAFVAARAAVDRAKRSARRFALAVAPAAAAPAGDDGEALVDLLLALRARRTAEGWAVADLSAAGLTQAAVAERLGVTPQAVSARATVAGLRLEQRAVPALVAVLASLDAASVAT